jgi:hypothetical protein
MPLEYYAVCPVMRTLSTFTSHFSSLKLELWQKFSGAERPRAGVLREADVWIIFNRRRRRE